jgi:hypothetical protein
VKDKKPPNKECCYVADILTKVCLLPFLFSDTSACFQPSLSPSSKEKIEREKLLCNHIQLEGRINIRTTNRFSFLPEQEDLTASMEEGKPILLDQCRQWS